MATPVRKLTSISPTLWLLLVLGVAGQLLWHNADPGFTARYQPLPPPPSDAGLRLAALGEEPILSRLMMLWLQAADTQPGASVSLQVLDYEKVRGWLAASLRLDPDSQYPLLVATRIYAAIPDKTRVRIMLEFIYQSFLQAPNKRWRWLAEASIIARHRLQDLALAKRYSLALSAKATGPQVPNWARDMGTLLLADMGEFEAAFALTAQLIKAGRITDPREIEFLKKQLDELQAESRRGAKPFLDGN